MAAQPADHDVEMMIQMCSIPRSEALLRLKGNNNDLTQAINEFFEDPDSKRYTWDESQFNSDRDGSGNNPGISFQVQGPDEPGPSGYYSSAPSRPPSRTSNRSPNDRVISLAAEHAAADPRNSMSQAEMEDSDLQKALAQSAEEAGLTPQEYGVTSTDTPHFGPANRPYYEQGKWDLVLPKSSVKEVGADPDAPDRKREEGKPAFLKPSLDDHRLAAILTIYHEIPLARELFLYREVVLPDYGHDAEWWTGKAIQLSNPAPWNENVVMEEEEVIYELQRLMAFLDKTERSYGSAEVLANLGIVKRAPLVDTESKFFSAWKDAREGDTTEKSIFSQAIQPKDVNGEDDELGEEDEQITFAILDLNLPNNDDSGELETLYDLADQALWSSSGLEIGTSAYLSHVADVVSFRITGRESSRRVKIPPIWYPDRYLESNKEASLEMRKQKAVIREKMMKISSLENKLTFVTLDQGKVVKVKDLFAASIMHDSEEIDQHNANEDSAESISEPRAGDKLNIAAELQKVLLSIEKKLKSLNEEQEKLREGLREVSKLYTGVDATSDKQPSHRYSLRGVSTSKDVMYLRKREEPDLIDMDIDRSDPNGNKDQWWKIEFGPATVNPPTITLVSQLEVLRAAVKEGQSSVVVYASDEAMAVPFQPLPDALEAFVRADNLAFSAEFPEQPETPEPQEQVTSPRSPAKRKYNETSEDPKNNESNDSAASLGEITVRNPASTVVNHEPIADAGDLSEQSFTAGKEPGHNNVIIGRDPDELIDVSIPGGNHAEVQEIKEMSSREGMPSLLPNLVTGEKIVAVNDTLEVDETSLKEQQEKA